MQLGSYPRLLILALSLPEMSHALGLGNIRVESRLNQPLSAQIDIIGATPDELKAISASVAGPELFQRYGAERPTFLSSASFSVGSDATGKPVLNIRSTEAFTEPLVELLIDLRSGKQELVRDYSLLLDPPGVTPAVSTSIAADSSEAAPPPVQAAAETSSIVWLPTTISIPEPQVAFAADPVAATSEMQYRVAANDTLRGIARQAGARSEAEQQRLMLAIYQSNRDAFAGNINLLHQGALLWIPPATEVQVFDNADVEREIRAQTTAWRRGARPTYRPTAAPIALARPEPAEGKPALPNRDVSAVLSKVNVLEGQVQFLQQTLGDASRQLATATARLADAERRAAQPPEVHGNPLAGPGQPAESRASWSTMLGALALLLGGLAYALWRFLSGRSRSRPPVRAAEPTVEAPLMDPVSVSASAEIDEAAAAYSVEESAPEPVAAGSAAEPDAAVGSDAADGGVTVELTQVMDIDVDTVEERGLADGEEADTIVLENLQPPPTDATSTALDYNLSDLDGHAQHVEMPGTLKDRPVLVERRKNVVDTLMAAIQRDPTRNDLRMKLLETLYTAAATNLRAFKEVARDLARHPERLNAEQWEQIMMMGRQIAADDALFAEQLASDDIADCA